MTAERSRTSRSPLRMPRRLGLRWRIALAFTLVSLAITGLLAAVTWQLASSFLTDKRVEGATAQASVDVRLVQNALGDPTGINDLLTGLAGGQDATVALRRGGEWTTSGRTLDTAALPDELVALAASGTPVRQRITAGGMPVLAVALPLPVPDGVYVELTPLSELDSTLRFLSWVLVVGVGVGGLLGFGLGRWAGDRALRPLTELQEAAARIAAGDLDTRLPEDGDADLGPLAATFNRTAEDLQRRVRRDARFAGDVSHELRSPLTTLINAVAVLRRRRAELPPTARQAVDLLDADIHRFQKMVTDLLEISRDEQLDDTDLESCLLVDLVAHAAHGRTGIDLELPPEGPHVVVDRRRLDRVIANLLDNAEHHAGGATRVAVLTVNGSARIEVDDAGPGIPCHLRQEVFERFARGTRAGDRNSSGGTGLGLALVARHVHAHHGRIWITDSPVGGTRVVVELPREQE